MNDLNMLVRVTDMTSLNQRRHLVAQTCHETGRYRWLLELATGEAYEGRGDLGNVYPGDGVKFKGAGVIMLTGRANVTRFSTWLERNGMRDDKVLEIGAKYIAAERWWRWRAPTLARRGAQRCSGEGGSRNAHVRCRPG